MTVIHIDFISDFPCVWCFVGKRSLDRAIALYRKTYPGGRTDDAFDIVHRPYLLNHANISMDKAELREQRLASWTPEKREAACRRVDKAGAAAGITFRDGGRVGPTQDAHRLLHSLRGRKTDASRAREDEEEEESVQEKLVEGLFSAFHEQERDISDKGVLREIGLAAGMTPEEIDHAFSSVEIAEEFEAEIAKYREFVAGTGVPVFIIQGQHRIDGAQDPMEFVEAFIKVKEAEAAKVAAA